MSRSVVISVVLLAVAGSVAHGQAIIHVPTDGPTIRIAIQQAQPFDTIIITGLTFGIAGNGALAARDLTNGKSRTKNAGSARDPLPG